MRKRIIKPQFWDSEKVARLPYGGRLAFIGLWQLADRCGHVRYNPRRIASMLFPFDDDSDVPGWIRQMQALGLVRVWESEQGHQVVTVLGFVEHQAIHPREAESIYEEELER